MNKVVKGSERERKTRKGNGGYVFTHVGLPVVSFQVGDFKHVFTH